MTKCEVIGSPWLMSLDILVQNHFVARALRHGRDLVDTFSHLYA